MCKSNEAITTMHFSTPILKRYSLYHTDKAPMRGSDHRYWMPRHHQWLKSTRSIVSSNISVNQRSWNRVNTDKRGLVMQNGLGWRRKTKQNIHENLIGTRQKTCFGRAKMCLRTMHGTGKVAGRSPHQGAMHALRRVSHRSRGGKQSLPWEQCLGNAVAWSTAARTRLQCRLVTL